MHYEGPAHAQKVGLRCSCVSKEIKLSATSILIRKRRIGAILDIRTVLEELKLDIWCRKCSDFIHISDIRWGTKHKFKRHSSILCLRSVFTKTDNQTSQSSISTKDL